MRSLNQYILEYLPISKLDKTQSNDIDALCDRLEEFFKAKQNKDINALCTYIIDNFHNISTFDELNKDDIQISIASYKAKQITVKSIYIRIENTIYTITKNVVRKITYQNASLQKILYDMFNFGYGEDAKVMQFNSNNYDDLTTLLDANLTSGY